MGMLQLHALFVSGRAKPCFLNEVVPRLSLRRVFNQKERRSCPASLLPAYRLTHRRADESGTSVLAALLSIAMPKQTPSSSAAQEQILNLRPEKGCIALQQVHQAVVTSRITTIATVNLAAMMI